MNTYTKIEHVALDHTKNAQYSSTHNGILNNIIPFGTDFVKNSELIFQFHISVIENIVEEIIISLYNSLKNSISIF